MNKESNYNPQNLFIIAAEDSLPQAIILEELLKKEGFQYKIVNTGLKAYDEIKIRKPDLVITDIVMPEMNGYELCKKIKENPETADLPVILLSSLSDPGDIIKGLDVRADSFITKPYKTQIVRRRIQSVYERCSPNSVNNRSSKIDFFQQGIGTIGSSDNELIDILISIYELSVTKQNETFQLRKNLQDTLKELEKLKQYLSMCASCHKVRVDEDEWLTWEQYVQKTTNIEFTHGLCPTCYKEQIDKLRPISQ